MISHDDPLPGDLETAHQLIRELIETLAQQVYLNDKLQRQLEKLLRQLYGKKTEVLPKSAIGEAISYARNHWAALVRPLEAGFLELDNGACERAFKPVALGRIVRRQRRGGADGGGADEPVHDVQGTGDRPASVPPR